MGVSWNSGRSQPTLRSTSGQFAPVTRDGGGSCCSTRLASRGGGSWKRRMCSVSCSRALSSLTCNSASTGPCPGLRSAATKASTEKRDSASRAEKAVANAHAPITSVASPGSDSCSCPGGAGRSHVGATSSITPNSPPAAAAADSRRAVAMRSLVIAARSFLAAFALALASACRSFASLRTLRTSSRARCASERNPSRARLASPRPWTGLGLGLGSAAKPR
mmetsp:Transcript_25693/g.82995  ORF Transcript_25693/g.82995 Transcript_25693/m.82995 type:complete len:221 (+) Transcript_25693:450-1112(+)